MKRGKWKYIAVVCVMAIVTLVMSTPMHIVSMAQADSGSLSMTGRYYQTDARSILSIINDFRQSEDAWYLDYDGVTKIYMENLQPFTWDYNLEQIAMQRAMECAIRWNMNHLRPDGSSCFTCSYNGVYSGMECLERMGGSAWGAYMDWREDYFKDQPHRAAMLSDICTCIGAAHVEVLGNHFWALEFGTVNTGGIDTGAFDGMATKTVPVNTEQLELVMFIDVQSAADSYSFGMYYGDSRELPPMALYYKLPETFGFGYLIDKSGYEPIEWKSVDESVVRVIDNRLYGVGVGNGNILAEGTYMGKTVSFYQETRVLPQHIVEATLGEIPDAIYTGKAICPEIPLSFQGKNLVCGVDYDVEYYDNVEMGEAHFIVSGKGNFEGDRAGSFTILSKNGKPRTDLRGAKIEFEQIPTQEYTGKPVCPHPKMWADGKELVEGVDYYLSYSDNINPGQAKVTFHFSEELILPFEGEFWILFSINQPQKVLLDLAKATLENRDILDADGKPVTKYFFLSYNGKELQKGTDYRSVSYELNSDTGEVREVYEGMGDYTGTKEVTYWYGDIMLGWRPNSSYIDLSGASVSSIPDQTYTGKPITPSVSVTLNGKKLKEGTDYVVGFFANVPIGQGICQVTGIGDYTGSVTVYFNIVEAGTPTKSPTVTPMVKDTNSPTPTLKPTPTGAQTPTPSPSPAITENVTVTPFEEASITPTDEPDISDMPTVSVGPTHTATQMVSPSLSPTPTLTEGVSPSMTPGLEPTIPLNELQYSEGSTDENIKETSHSLWWIYLVFLLVIILIIVILTMV